LGIVENIKEICAHHQITIPKLEKELGFGNGTIYNWAKSSPSIDKIQKVADYFDVSIERVIYGFDASLFSQALNLLKGNRTFEQFAKDIGADPNELAKYGLGLILERPNLELVKKIASDKNAQIIYGEDYLFEIAGFISERQGESIQRKKLDDLYGLFEKAGFEVRFENEDHYEKIYIDHPDHGTVSSMFLHEFVDRGESLLEELKRRYAEDDIQTLAAHHDGEDWTPEELEEIERFKEFVRMRRKMKSQE